MHSRTIRHISTAGYGAGRYGTGEESVAIALTDGARLDALDFAGRVVAAWEAFFAKHGIEG